MIKWLKNEVVHHEGGLPLALLALAAAVLGFVHYQVAPQQFKEVEHTLHFLVLDVLLVAFFSLMAIGIQHLVHHQGRKVIYILTALAIMGAVLPALSYLILSQSYGYTPEGAIVPTATDVIYSRTALTIAGADTEVIRLVGHIGVIDDGLGLLSITGIELLHAIRDGQLTDFIIRLMIGLAIIAFATILTWLMNQQENGLKRYLIPVVISWIGFYIGGLHPVLAGVPVMLIAKPSVLTKYETPLVLSMFIIIPLFGYITGGVDPADWSPLTTIILGSLFAMKMVGIGFGALYLRRFSAHLQQFTNGELIVSGLMAGIGFKVAGFAAILVFQGELLQEALLATNSSVLLGIGVAILLRGTHLIGLRWSRKHAPSVDDFHGV